MARRSRGWIVLWDECSGAQEHFAPSHTIHRIIARGCPPGSLYGCVAYAWGLGALWAAWPPVFIVTHCRQKARRAGSRPTPPRGGAPQEAPEQGHRRETWGLTPIPLCCSEPRAFLIKLNMAALPPDEWGATGKLTHAHETNPGGADQSTICGQRSAGPRLMGSLGPEPLRCGGARQHSLCLRGAAGLMMAPC
jgi:hypothetical protein